MVEKKIGRPPKKNIKDYMLRVRLDEITLNKLDKCCEKEKLTRSEIVRNGILEQYDRIKE